MGYRSVPLRRKSKRLGPNHELAAALWDTDRYEARMLATFIDEPGERVTSAQMDHWCRDFDNWAILDLRASRCSIARRTHGQSGGMGAQP